MKIGYARVSTNEQNLDMQTDALDAAGCEKTFTDIHSGAIATRPGLEDAKKMLREGDVLVVWRLDRLGRNLKNLIENINFFEEKKVGFISLNESINTTTSTGKLIFHIFCVLAEFERNLISERTNSGLIAARSRGKLGGRPKKLDKKQRENCVELHKKGDFSVQKICEIMKISRPTLYTYLNEE